MRSPWFAALCLILVGSLTAPAEAQDRKFPYEAVISIDGEYVRSGPGPSFYPTDKLKRGDKVMVHRHDPGGWCMIAPPPGSFSWILAKNVKKTDNDRGVLNANKVVVHVGSSINPDEFTTIQGNLSQGDAVEILGEKTFAFEDGDKLMYKISPIKREWRWIPRKALAATDSIHSEPFPAEPAPRGKKPAGPVANQNELDPDAFAKPISTGPIPTGSELEERRPSKSRSPEKGAAIGPDDADGFRTRLDKIDRQFREMIQQDPSTWSLDGIAQQYRDLDREASQPAISNTIALRLDAVARYEKIHRDYVEFLKLSAETKQRDAQLASLQLQHENQLRTLTGGTAPATPTPIPTPVAQPTLGAGQPIANAAPGGAPTASTNTPANPNGFAGAGIVQPMSKSFAGGPQHALIAPNGKLLAYLQPAPGVDLRRYNGQSMGIIGDRQFRQDWGADVITVRGLQPVQLRASR